MGITLIINPGSSSKKYTLAEAGEERATFRYERSGEGYVFSLTTNSGVATPTSTITSVIYEAALHHALQTAVARGLITALYTINKIGIRIVAPGTYFQTHRTIDDTYIDGLRKKEFLAPLHIPPILAEIDAVGQLLPEVPVLGISDSAFHATLPAKARNYALAPTVTEALDLYHFGYHGLSYASVARRLSSLVLGPSSRVIVCHIGSGMSLCALKDGVSIDTTMGLAPGSGLMMGARTGDLEPAVVLALMSAWNAAPRAMMQYLSSEGGFVGLTGEADFRHLLARYEAGEANVQAAFEQCRYYFQKTIGAYAVALGGLDAVVFTATAAERSPRLRALLLEKLSVFDIAIDATKNATVVGSDGVISPTGAAVTVVVATTKENEEMLRVIEEPYS